jgi:uncharacterized membrane protein
MVLEMKVPHGTDLAALRPVAPVFISYILSFVYLAIYWNNHHHMLKLTHKVNGAILWANMHLLFWLSLVPFVSGWVGENRFAGTPVAIYGVVLLMAALAWTILQQAILRHQGADGKLAHALGKDFKGKLSPVLYVAGIGLAFVQPWVGFALYALVAAMWLVPDRRFESHATAVDA